MNKNDSFYLLHFSLYFTLQDEGKSQDCQLFSLSWDSVKSPKPTVNNILEGVT